MYSDIKALLRLIVPVVVLLVGLASLLIAVRVESVLLESAQARGQRAVHYLAGTIEQGFRLGLALSEQRQIVHQLERQRDQDANMVAVRVYGEGDEIVASSGNADAFRNLKPVWNHQLFTHDPPPGKSETRIVRGDGGISYIGAAAFDSSGRGAAAVWLAYDRRAVFESALAVIRKMWLWAITVALALTFGLTALSMVWIRAAVQRLAAIDASLSESSESPGRVVLAVDGEVRSVRRICRDWAFMMLALSFTCTGLAALAWHAREIAHPMLIEQIDKSAQSVLSNARNLIDRALTVGIPLAGLTGLQEVFEAELASAPEVEYMALQRVGSSVAIGEQPGNKKGGEIDQGLSAGANSGSFRLSSEPLEVDGRTEAKLWVGTPANYVDRQLRAVLLDLFLAVVVSLVLVRELLGVLWKGSIFTPYLTFEESWQALRRRAYSFGRHPAVVQCAGWLAEARSAVRSVLRETPDHTRDTRITGFDMEMVRLRLAVFLTAMSDELLRPFFSVFAAEVSPLPFVTSPAMLAGLPLAAFMIALTVAQPLGPWISARVPLRRALVVTALVGAALIAATAFTLDGTTLVLLRACSGAVYGTMLILAQTTVVRITGHDQRARGLVEVPAAIVAAGVCGPALGGLIVERAGSIATFLCCAACLVSAAWACRGISAVPVLRPIHSPDRKGGWCDIVTVMKHPRIAALMWLAAVPARLAAAAVLVVVTPLYIQALGESPAVSGRVQMLYFIAFMLAAPAAAHWSDASGRRRPWIVWGCTVSALACAGVPLWGGVVGLALCCALLGVGQAMMSAPVIALVTEIFDHDKVSSMRTRPSAEHVLAAFRFIERFGSILAPFAAAFAVGQYGLAGAVGAIGALVAIGAIGISAALFHVDELGKTHAPAQ